MKVPVLHVGLLGVPGQGQEKLLEVNLLRVHLVSSEPRAGEIHHVRFYRVSLGGSGGGKEEENSFRFYYYYYPFFVQGKMMKKKKTRNKRQNRGARKGATFLSPFFFWKVRPCSLLFVPFLLFVATKNNKNNIRIEEDRVRRRVFF